MFITGIASTRGGVKGGAMKIRTPETVTAVQRACALGISERPTDTNEKSKAAREVAEQIRANFSDVSSAPPASVPFDFNKADDDMSFALLPIDAIEPYHYNPRTGRNPRYHEIKESIRADGITNMLTVTRRDKLSKYTTYGGGNTRLMIAKELAAEGDARFATLQVVVKAWPGDAQIITAQLAENENRGDITFWEKAQAVQQFRAEFEKESGQTLSSVELHSELRRSGLNYAPKTLQNFAFSVENLAPIGRWLGATAVNESIRPAWSGLLGVAEKLGKGGQARAALDDVLQLHGIRLECAEQPAELDVQRLLDDWQAAFAKLLDMSVQQLQAMLAALRADAGIDAQALRDVSVTLPVEKGGDGVGAVRSSLPPRAASFKPEIRDDEEAQNDEITPQGSHSAREAQPNLQGLLTPIPSLPEPEVEPLPEKLLAEIKEQLGRISQIVPLHDVICACDMPFGFIVDFPAEGDDWSKVGGMDVPQPHLRAAMWRFLVSISGQLDRRVPLPSEGATFSHALAKDKEAFCAEFEKRGMPMNGAMPLMEVGEIAAIFADPNLAKPVIKLLDTIEKLRAADPERAPDFFERRFA